MAQTKRGGSAAREKRQRVPSFRLRVQIVAASLLGEVTPREIAAAEGLNASTVQYHFGALEREGWIHVSRKEPVRGGMRQYYVADRLNLITDGEFERMNEQARLETSAGVLVHFVRICTAALKEGTLDARADSHLSHTPMDLDRQGWRDLQNDLARMLERSLEIKVEAMMRRRKSGEEPIPTVVNLAGFEVPPSVTEG